MPEWKTRNGICYYESQLLARYGFEHLFATRYGGVSAGAFASLNVSTTRKDADGQPDAPENVVENYRRALAVFGVTPDRATAAKQTHTDIVLEADASFNGRGILQNRAHDTGFDGTILRRDNADSPLAACVKTADCAPILLADITTGDVAAVHAGWRGTVADIAAKAAVKLSHGHTENVAAAIGPCIGVCCYEVGDEVYTAAKLLVESKGKRFDEERLCPVYACCSLGGKRHFDLAGMNKELLITAGVRPENIELSGLCTACFTDEYGNAPFFSHRASGGHSGTFVSVIRVRR